VADVKSKSRKKKTRRRRGEGAPSKIKIKKCPRTAQIEIFQGPPGHKKNFANARR